MANDGVGSAADDFLPLLHFYNTGCIAVLSKDTKYYLEDGCAAIENILLAAADLGIGACWIAGDKKPYAGDIVKLLGAPTDIKLVGLISLGWPKQPAKQKKNRSLEKVMHWEKY